MIPRRNSRWQKHRKKLNETQYRFHDHRDTRVIDDTPSLYGISVLGATASLTINVAAFMTAVLVHAPAATAATAAATAAPTPTTAAGPATMLWLSLLSTRTSTSSSINTSMRAVNYVRRV